jgi:hypothetical protein
VLRRPIAETIFSAPSGTGFYAPLSLGQERTVSSQSA